MTPTLKYLLMAIWPVVTAVWIDLGAWSASRKDARDKGLSLPPFDFAVALPRYLTGLVGGAMAVATTFVPELGD